MINVTQTYVPPFEEYAKIIKTAWDKKWLTNNGELVQQLEMNIKDYLKVDNFLFCSNGTIVLQMALKVLNISKEVITTPFSYVATTNALLWEGCKPVFVDINPDTFCIDAHKIEEAITSETQAILATHVYGIACDIEKIESIAKKHNLYVIYDSAHAFGSEFQGQSLLNFGDISTCSFHATKIFHTVEGGCLISRNKFVHEKLELFRSFGHVSDDYFSIGINGKNSELHAAMGLCTLPKLKEIIENRKVISKYYDSKFVNRNIRKPVIDSRLVYNYSYYPIVFEEESILLKVRKALLNNDVSTRRYFYPSLNNLPFIQNKFSCPISEKLSKSVLCLPLYYDLKFEDIDRICDIIIKII